MIYEDDLHNLSGLSPEQRFYKIELLARKRLEEARLNTNINEPLLYNDYDYAVVVSGAADACGIDELMTFELPWPSNEDAEDRCRMFRANATRVSNRLMFSENGKVNSVALDHATKQKLSHWLNGMRETVACAEISEEKKDRLLTLINKLQAEVDRERTPVQAAGELWLSVCTYIAQGAKRLEPVSQAIQKFGAALGAARETEDTPRQISSRQAPKRIEPPQKKNEFSKDLDDEIPF